MKVIKKGRPQKGWSKQYKCTGAGNGGGGCGTILLVSKYDIYQTSMGEIDELDTFCCCQCGVETDIENLPVSPEGTRPPEAKRREIAEKNMRRKK